LALRVNQSLFNPFLKLKNKEKVVLHSDMIDGMTTDQIKEMAFSEYESRLPDSAELEVKISSDDGGRLIEFIVRGEYNAKILREDLPPNYKKNENSCYLSQRRRSFIRGSSILKRLVISDTHIGSKIL
jgi:ribosomal protein S6E (S10)